MIFLVKILLMLLLGVALFISLLLGYLSDFLGLQSRSKFIITSLNKIAFFTVAAILTDNFWYIFYLIKQVEILKKILVQNLIPLKNLASAIGI